MYTKSNLIEALREGQYWNAMIISEKLGMSLGEIMSLAQRNNILMKVSGVSECEILWRNLEEEQYDQFISNANNSKVSISDLKHMLQCQIDHFEYIDEYTPYGLDKAFEKISKMEEGLLEEINLRDEVFASYEDSEHSKGSLNDDERSESGYSETSTLSTSSTGSFLAPDGDMHSYFAGAIDAGTLNLRAGHDVADLSKVDIVGLHTTSETSLVF